MKRIAIFADGTWNSPEQGGATKVLQMARAVQPEVDGTEQEVSEHIARVRELLLASGGKIQVPCLQITDEQGNVTWMYESEDIIQYLNREFA